MPRHAIQGGRTPSSLLTYPFFLGTFPFFLGTLSAPTGRWAIAHGAVGVGKARLRNGKVLGMAQPVAVELHGGRLPDEINAGLWVIVAVVVLGLVDGELAG